MRQNEDWQWKPNVTGSWNSKYPIFLREVEIGVHVHHFYMLHKALLRNCSWLPARKIHVTDTFRRVLRICQKQYLNITNNMQVIKHTGAGCVFVYTSVVCTEDTRVFLFNVIAFINVIFTEHNNQCNSSQNNCWCKSHYDIKAFHWAPYIGNHFTQAKIVNLSSYSNTNNPNWELNQAYATIWELWYTLAMVSNRYFLLASYVKYKQWFSQWFLTSDQPPLIPQKPHSTCHRCLLLPGVSSSSGKDCTTHNTSNYIYIQSRSCVMWSAMGDGSCCIFPSIITTAITLPVTLAN